MKTTRCRHCGETIERQADQLGRLPLWCPRPACQDAKLLAKREAGAAWWRKKHAAQPRRRPGVVGFRMPAVAPSVAAVPAELPPTAAQVDVAIVAPSPAHQAACQYLSVVRQTRVPMADCDDCPMAATCPALLDLSATGDASAVPKFPARVPPSSMELAEELTDDQVQDLLGQVVQPTVQGTALPACPECRRIRIGRHGTDVAGMVVCLKDELILRDTRLGGALDRSGRPPIVEDRRGDASVYWLRPDVAHLGSARGCKYYLRRS